MKVTIIFGNITFDGNDAIVHEVNDILRIEKDEAEEVADSLVNLYDAYIIPSLFKGEIKWREGVSVGCRGSIFS